MCGDPAQPETSLAVAVLAEERSWVPKAVSTLLGLYIIRQNQTSTHDRNTRLPFA